MNDTVAKFLSEQYRPNLKALLALAPTQVKPGSRGYAAEAARVLNARLKPYDLEILAQYISDWRAGKKVQRGGIDVPGVLSLGLGIFPGHEPRISYALATLYLSDCWDGLNPTPESVSKLLASGFKQQSTGQLDRIEAAITRVERALSSTNSTPTIADKLLSATAIDAASVERVARELFSAKHAGRVISLFADEIAIEKINSSDCAKLALFIAETTGEPWSVEQVEQLLARASSLGESADLAAPALTS